MSHRGVILGLLLAAANASCVRWVQQTGDVALDAGVIEASVADGPSDQVKPSDLDARLGGLNGPCNPGQCEPGLVCTGGGSTWFCRPPCAFNAGLCPDAQLCARPSNALASAPRACLVPAAKWGSCAVMPCAKTMGCVIGGTGRYCYPACSGGTGCAAGSELCLPIGTSIIGTTFSGCVPICVAGTACPSGHSCAGVDPQDVCVPAVPVGTGQACGSQPCATGLRCFGNVGVQHYCYPICTTTCTGGRTCVPVTTDRSLCVTPCDPFGAASQCASFEVCLPTPTGSGYCIAGPGETGSCGTLPCVTNMICVQGSCLKLCNGTHPCATGTCTSLVGKDGGATSWSACAP
jgi:hypothetical protein